MKGTSAISKMLAIVIAVIIIAAAIAGAFYYSTTLGPSPSPSPSPSPTSSPLPTTAWTETDWENWARSLKSKYNGKSLRMVSISDPFIIAVKAETPLWQELTGTTVSVESADWPGIVAKESTELAAGSASYDIMTTEFSIFGLGFIKKGYFEPLDPYINNKTLTPEGCMNMSDWTKFYRDEMIFDSRYGGDDKYYGLPAYHICQILVYRKDILAKYGYQPPNNLAEYIQLVKNLNASLAGTGMYANAQKALRSEIFHDWTPYLYENGGLVFDSNLMPALNSSEALKALNDYLTVREYGPPGQASFGNDEIMNTLQLNISAMANTWDGQLGFWAKTGPNQQWANYGFKAMYQVPWGISWMYDLNKFGTQKDLAWQYMLWITRPQADKTVSHVAGAPVRASTIGDPIEAAVNPWYSESLKALAREYQWPHLPEVFSMEFLWGDMSSAYVGALAPQAALQDMTDKAYVILKDAGYYD